MTKVKLLESLKGGLIVSCQALEDEPLHSSFIMSKMAYAAKLGGACGIRANGGQDIKAIKAEVNLPIIGLKKAIYNDSKVYITPTIKEVIEVYEAGADIIAIDATDRVRPNGKGLSEFVKEIKSLLPSILLMGDISQEYEGRICEEIGFDMVSTTLSGYTEETKGKSLPDFQLMEELCNKLSIPVFAEGGISYPADLKKAIDIGVHGVVVGSAITRPMEITQRFVKALND